MHSILNYVQRSGLVSDCFHSQHNILSSFLHFLILGLKMILRNGKKESLPFLHALLSFCILDCFSLRWKKHVLRISMLWTLSIKCMQASIDENVKEQKNLVLLLSNSAVSHLTCLPYYYFQVKADCVFFFFVFLPLPHSSQVTTHQCFSGMLTWLSYFTLLTTVPK